jgi:chromosomal replication initiation ATPase DnaA
LLAAPACLNHLSEVSRYSVRRDIENEPRDVAMYLIRSLRSEPLFRVGAGFGLNRYSSVSSAVIRVKTTFQKDGKFKDRLECLESNILKGQT